MFIIAPRQTRIALIFMNYILSIMTAVFFLQAVSSYAAPTQSGSTGLLTVPTADTLGPGNVCVGVWSDISTKDDKHSVIAPVGLTIGLGASWEAYASYPNIMLNDQEDLSGKGRAELGTKVRFYGKSNSRLKFAADLFGQRTISPRPEFDGLTNYGARILGSLITKPVGLHAYTGYLFTGDPPNTSYDNEILFGLGADVPLTSRTKLTLELTGNTSGNPNLDDPLEGTAGLSYYLSPHLTLNIAGAVGLSEANPDWRAIFGFSTCQGIGTYVKPVPTLRKPGEVQQEKVAKPVKIVPLTPLLMNAAVPVAPVSKLEVQVEPDQEEVYVRPRAQVIIPAAESTTSSVTLPPLAASASPIEKPKTQSTEPSEKIAAAPLPSEPPPEEVLADGESPVYGIEVKGDKLSIGAARSSSSNVRMYVYRKYRFPDVNQEYTQMDVSPELKKSLAEVADLLRNDKKWSFLRIDAHTDGIGSSSYNMDLSLKRAIAIASYLTTYEGIDPSRILVKGMGKSRLLADNATSEGRMANRRFEILLLVPR